MFSSSVRRAALTVPPAPIVSSLSTTAPRAAASQAFNYRSHQRRFSSSKPSSPADGSRHITGDLTGAPTQARPAEKKSRGGKKKAKEEKPSSQHNLPSVPSTQHIPTNHITASDFFSLYRPISLTSSFPKAVTEAHFASIFTPRTKNNSKASSDVINTLSNTVHQLDAATGNLKRMKLESQQEWNEETDVLRAAMNADAEKRGLHQLDGTEESIINFPKHILSGTFYRPFHPPPPPTPMNTSESIAAGAEAAESLEPQYKTYTAVVTIEESTDANGDVTYSAHSSPLIEEPTTPARFLDRMQIRKERYREKRAEENAMIAISVKRQRKLKMKKHKYKKLMKRTRNLRRKLDRN